MTNEYIERLTEWKDDYKLLSVVIREEKKKRKQFTWDYKKIPGAKSRTKVGPNPTYDESASWKVESFRHRARIMMTTRTEMKEEAREYWNNTEKVLVEA